MNIMTISTAKRYAQAYVRVFRPVFESKDIENITRCSEFLQSNIIIGVALTMSTISPRQRIDILALVQHRYQLPDSMRQLFILALNRRRIDILPDILRGIVTEVRKQRGEELVTITSSHALDDMEQKKLTTLVTAEICPHPITTFVIDPTLICGVRIQSQTHRWEYSIKRRLRLLTHNLTQQECL